MRGWVPTHPSISVLLAAAPGKRRELLSPIAGWVSGVGRETWAGATPLVDPPGHHHAGGGCSRSCSSRASCWRDALSGERWGCAFLHGFTPDHRCGAGRDAGLQGSCSRLEEVPTRSAVGLLIPPQGAVGALSPARPARRLGGTDGDAGEGTSALGTSLGAAVPVAPRDPGSLCGTGNVLESFPVGRCG